MVPEEDAGCKKQEKIAREVAREIRMIHGMAEAAAGYIQPTPPRAGQSGSKDGHKFDDNEGGSRHPLSDDQSCAGKYFQPGKIDGCQAWPSPAR